MNKSKNLNREEKIQLIALLTEKNKRDARIDLLKFTEYTMPNFKAAPFHKSYYKVLDLFCKGVIKRLMVTIPPQNGKSEGSTRRLPSFLFGTNPDLKIAVSSYNSTFARKFNRDIQRIIDDDEYKKLFPKTTLNYTNTATISNSYLRNSEEFEIVGHKGSLKAVGRGGALTGNTVDIMIMDDLYKDYAEGNSPIIRDAVWDWYTTVVKTRLHNDSQELIVFTRWHEDDLIGRLEKKEKVIVIESLDDIELIESDTWVKINFEAIKTGDKTDIDNRCKGEPLWAEKHSLKRMEDVRALSPEKFNCLYQGNPISAEGLMYRPFKTYDDLPEMKIIKNYTDTADSGTDYLCSIVYGIPLNSSDGLIYIIDILYTQEPMESTELKTIDLINNNGVNWCDIESNNGGRGFARIVASGTKAEINPFHQSKNKEARIYSNSATVNNLIVFPSNWHIQWSEFYDHLTKYKKLFKANKTDDIADTITGIVEKQNNTFDDFTVTIE